ncbi:MAG: amidohydrolase, partial [Candidatus Aminicenantales bacterium]
MFIRTFFRYLACVLAAAAVLVATGCAPKKEPADLVLKNGKIATMDAAVPEVEALAVRGSTIVAVGDDGDIAPYIGEATQVIDLEGRLAIPGFIESHGHFTSIGRAKLQLDLTKARSWDE